MKLLKETSTSDLKPKKCKEQYHLKKTSLGPLRQGQRLDTSETKPYSSKERKPPIQSLNNTKSSPCTYASSPWAKAHFPWTMQQCNTEMQQRAKTCSICPGRLDHLTNIWPLGGRLDHPMWPALHQTTQNLPEPIGTLSKCSSCPNHAQTSPPCWQCMNQGKLRKVSTYSFSNIQNSSQGATDVQMSKLDTLQVRNDLNYMITKFHNHWTRLKRIWVILRKFTLSWAKS
jgi:hypothetical protein